MKDFTCTPHPPTDKGFCLQSTSIQTSRVHFWTLLAGVQQCFELYRWATAAVASYSFILGDDHYQVGRRCRCAACLQRACVSHTSSSGSPHLIKWFLTSWEVHAPSPLSDAYQGQPVPGRPCPPVPAALGCALQAMVPFWDALNHITKWANVRLAHHERRCGSVRVRQKLGPGGTCDGSWQTETGPWRCMG
jgi:hypothetical protein